MGNIINFPKPSYAKKGGKVSFGLNKVDVGSWEYNFLRKERYFTIINGLNRDSMMAVALGVASNDVGGRRVRDRSEEDFIEIYSSRIKMEISDINNSNDFFKKILREAGHIADCIRKAREKLRRGGITERESLEIGFMKKELRSKLVKYLLIKEEFFEDDFEYNNFFKIAV